MYHLYYCMPILQVEKKYSLELHASLKNSLVTVQLPQEIEMYSFLFNFYLRDSKYNYILYI